MHADCVCPTRSGSLLGVCCCTASPSLRRGIFNNRCTNTLFSLWSCRLNRHFVIDFRSDFRADLKRVRQPGACFSIPASRISSRQSARAFGRFLSSTHPFPAKWSSIHSGVRRSFCPSCGIGACFFPDRSSISTASPERNVSIVPEFLTCSASGTFVRSERPHLFQERFRVLAPLPSAS